MSYRFLSLVCLLFWAAIPKAEIPEESILFSKAREIIFSHNGVIKAVATETEAAKSGILQAGVLPNPAVSLGLDKLGANEIEVTIEQTFELGNKRHLRKKLSENQVEALHNNRNISNIELDAEITRRFIPITVISQKMALLDSIIETVEATRDQIDIRIQAGASKKTDQLRVEIELEQLALQRSEMVRQLQQAKNKFAALGSEKDSLLLLVSGSLHDNAAVPSLADLRKAHANIPQVKAADSEIAELSLKQQLLKAEAIPDLDLSIGYVRNNEDETNTPVMGISMEIPIFNKNKDAQKQVELQKQAVKERQESEYLLRDAEIQDLNSRLLELDKNLSALSKGTISKALNLYTMIQEYYHAGNASFLELMESQAELLQLQMSLLDIREERALTLTDLMELTALKFDIVK